MIQQLRRDQVPCPMHPECAVILTLAAGDITAHLVDVHAYTKIGAEAYENVTRREVLGGAAPVKKTPRPARRGERHHCSVCGHEGTRRDYCPNCANHPAAAGAAVDDQVDAAAPDDDRPLYRVGRLMDELRDLGARANAAADELDALVAAGLIP